MTKNERLGALKKSGLFTDCSSCGFSYLPMSVEAFKHCPKCGPKSFVDPDQEYIDNETVIYEEISCDQINDPEPQLMG